MSSVGSVIKLISIFCFATAVENGDRYLSVKWFETGGCFNSRIIHINKFVNPISRLERHR